MMKSFQEQLSAYQSHHQKAPTKITHFIGIPLIFLSLAMLLNWFSLGIFNRWIISFSWIGLITLLIYYFILNFRLAMIATVILAIITWFGTLLATTSPNRFSIILFLIFFISGWALQFIGHGFEKSKPAFTENLTSGLVAPLFLLVEAFEKLGWNKYFGLPHYNHSDNK